MSQEIQFTISGTVKNPSGGGGFVDTIPSLTLKLSQNVVGAEITVQSVPTTAAGTALGIGLVTTVGWMYAQNLDGSNYVEIGVQVTGTFYPLVKLKAGEVALFRVSAAATPYARANTAAVNLAYRLYND